MKLARFSIQNTIEVVSGGQQDDLLFRPIESDNFDHPPVFGNEWHSSTMYSGSPDSFVGYRADPHDFEMFIGIAISIWVASYFCSNDTVNYSNPL